MAEDYEPQLDEEAGEAYDDLPALERMIFDIENKIPITVGFCERQQDYNAAALAQFLVQHPKFEPYLRPILNYEPEFAGGEIKFHYYDDMLQAIITGIALYVDQPPMLIEIPISLETLKEFLTLVEPIACFMTDSSDRGLNF